MLKAYYYLTKPGIIYGNAITMIAGFFLASKGRVNFFLLVEALVGLSFIIAAGCVLNNYFDQGIDARMDRTKNRSLVTHEISGPSAIIFAGILLILGIFTLEKFTNPLTLGIALVGLAVYVGIYTPLKRRSVHGTLVGAVAGAVPPVVGYAAITNRLDLGAWLLFLVLVTWQMPHFFAIAIRRLDEYTAAKIPVLPAVQGTRAAKIQMLYYLLAFILAVVSLAVFGFTGFVYLILMSLLCAYWLWLCLRGFQAADEKLWAKKVFLFSLVTITGFSLAVILDSFIFIKL